MFRDERGIALARSGEAEVGSDDTGAGREQGIDAGAADAARTTGDDSDAAGQIDSGRSSIRVIHSELIVTDC